VVLNQEEMLQQILVVEEEELCFLLVYQVLVETAALVSSL
tara:strand:+ start:395 stop:514 length:120 start_codon:yes stop_codon:yes gene_type:complete